MHTPALIRQTLSGKGWTPFFLRAMSTGATRLTAGEGWRVGAADLAAALATPPSLHSLAAVAHVFFHTPSHYPVFHQMEGVRLFPESEMASHIGGPVLSGEMGDDPELQRRQREHTLATSAYIARDLKDTLSGTRLLRDRGSAAHRGSVSDPATPFYLCRE